MQRNIDVTCAVRGLVIEAQSKLSERILSTKIIQEV